MASSKDLLNLEVATPLGLALSTEAEHVEAPSVQGEFGVYPGHLPILAALRCGLLKYTLSGKEHVAAIGAGFAEGEPDRMLILTDRIAMPDQIDANAVRAELKVAEDRLKEFKAYYEGAEYDELQREVDWANARLDAVTHHKK